MGRYFEFFAGGGMARAGLGPGWACAFANDVDPKKVASYHRNWGAGEILRQDVRRLRPAALPGRPDLLWASFPCQDLSLAGAGSGLAGERSGCFWPFWSLAEALRAEGRGARIVALENVCGLITRRGGADLSVLIETLAETGGRVGAMVADAAWFVPQSRPRLFLFAVDAAAAERLFALGRAGAEPDPRLAPAALRRVAADLSGRAAEAWFWPRPPAPAPRRGALADLLEADGPDLSWDAPGTTARLLAQMSPRHRAEIEALRKGGARRVGTAFRRMRQGAAGRPEPRIEPRFDGLAGCLRTPAGGSSRQILLEVQGRRTRSRLLTPRETARLMGLPDAYRLPPGRTEAYHLTGDGVAAPVVRWLAETLFEPALGMAPQAAEEGAPAAALAAE